MISLQSPFVVGYVPLNMWSVVFRFLREDTSTSVPTGNDRNSPEKTPDLGFARKVGLFYRSPCLVVTLPKRHGDGIVYIAYRGLK